jgi:hypothetical protein
MRNTNIEIMMDLLDGNSWKEVIDIILPVIETYRESYYYIPNDEVGLKFLLDMLKMDNFASLISSERYKYEDDFILICNDNVVNYIASVTYTSIYVDLMDSLANDVFEDKMINEMIDALVECELIDNGKKTTNGWKQVMINGLKDNNTYEDYVDVLNKYIAEYIEDNNLIEHPLYIRPWNDETLEYILNTYYEDSLLDFLDCLGRHFHKYDYDCEFMGMENFESYDYDWLRNEYIKLLENGDDELDIDAILLDINDYEDIMD